MRWPGLVVVAAAVGLLLTACGRFGGGETLLPPAQDLQRLHALVNEARAQARTCGDVAYAAAPALALEHRLMAAAQKHSVDMHEHGFMSHTGSDGSTLSERVEREGYAWTRLGENVAWGYTTPESVMAGWLTSPGHCANLMRTDYTELGLGREGNHWTQVFAQPR